MMGSLKRVTEISVDVANSIKGGKDCSCSCSCSCGTTDTKATLKDSNKDASAASTFAGGSQPW